MQPREIAGLDPFYADERGIAEFAARKRLHAATAKLNEVAEQRGQQLDKLEVELGLKDRIFALLGLDDDDLPPDEAFFEARILPPHDTFTTPEGVTVPSRFLVVDARNPMSEVADEANPTQRIRAYFLLLSESYCEPIDLLPYFVVSDCEIAAKGKPDEQLRYVTSAVFYSPHSPGWPLHAGEVPLCVAQAEPYSAMAAECELAVSTLATQ